MKRIFLFFIFSLLTYFSYSDWSQSASSTTKQINDIHFLNKDEGFYCGDEGIYKTIDGGISWNKMEFTNNDPSYLSKSIFYSVHFFNQDTGFAAGFNPSVYGTIIIKTTDGGQDWEIIQTGNNGDTFFDLYFLDKQRILAIGEYGEIEYSQNGGGSWSPKQSSTNENLYSIDFASDSVGCIVGGQTILRTTNANSSWNTIQYNPDEILKSFDFANDSTGYAVGHNGLILKTNDTGATWKRLHTNFNYKLTGVHFISRDTGFAVSQTGEILKTENGGKNWEYRDFETPLQTIHFADSQNGYAGGENGFLLHTNDQGNPYAPIASFDANTNTFCQDSTVKFINNGLDSYSYKWFLNDSILTTQKNLSSAFSKGDSYDTISLVADNGYFTDTAEFVVHTEPSLESNLVTNLKEDTLCPGNTSEIEVINSEYNADYRLLKNDNPVNSSKNGNGGILSFITDPLYQTTSFSLKASKSNACGTNDSLHNYTIHVMSPDTTLPVRAENETVCNKDSTKIRLGSTVKGSSYVLHNGTDSVGKSITGNDSTIVLETSSISDTTTYSILVENKYGCNAVLQEKQTIAPRNLKVNFKPSLKNTYTGDSIYFNNLSNADSYFWNFDTTTASSRDTSALEPNTQYNTTGKKVVRLKGSAKIGCKDTALSTVSVFQTPPQSKGSYCYFDTISRKSDRESWNQVALEYHVDSKGNSYIGGSNEYTGNYEDRYFLFLKKFDPQGNLVWEKHMVKENYYNQENTSFVTGIETDDNGNVYITGNYALQDFILDTFHIKHNEINPQYFVAKLDSTGETQWLIHSNSQANHPKGGTDIEYINDNKIYVGIYGPARNTKFADGSKHSLEDNYSRAITTILEINSRGHYKKHSYIKHNTSLRNQISLFNPEGFYWYDTRVTAVSPELEYSPYSGDLFVFGKFQDYLIFDSTRLEGNSPGNIYAARYDTSGHWKNTFLLMGRNLEYENDYDVFPNIALGKKESIYISEPIGIKPYGDPEEGYIRFNNGTEVHGSNHSIFAKYDNKGKLLWYNKNKGLDVRGIEFYNNEQIILLGQYKNFLGVNSKNNISSYGTRSKGEHDLCLISYSQSGEANWVNNFGTDTYEKSFFLDQNKQCEEIYMLGMLQDTIALATDTLFYSPKDPSNPSQNFAFHFSPSGYCAFGCDTARSSCTTFNGFEKTSCGNYTVPSKDTTYNKSGLYIDTLKAKNSDCDNILAIDLTVKPNASITKKGDSLIASNPDAAYQWLDCNNNYQPIPGATNMVFNSSKAGSYAVEISGTGCKDTSSCMKTTTTGVINTDFESGFSTYPNPTSGIIKTELSRNFSKVHVTLTSASGKEVLAKDLKNVRKFSLNLQNSEPGLYLLSIQTQSGKTARIRIIKQ